MVAATAMVVAVGLLTGNPVFLLRLLVFLPAFAAALCTREGELVRLRSSAAAMQRQILQPLPVLTDDVLVDGVYEPVQQDEFVGGDIYEVAATPWGTRVLMGDVQGKGLAAIGVAIAVVGAFREAAHREPTLTALVDALEAAVVRHNDYSGQRGEPERFVTALVVGVDKGAEAQID